MKEVDRRDRKGTRKRVARSSRSHRRSKSHSKRRRRTKHRGAASHEFERDRNGGDEKPAHFAVRLARRLKQGGVAATSTALSAAAATSSAVLSAAGQATWLALLSSVSATTSIVTFGVVIYAVVYLFSTLPLAFLMSHLSSNLGALFEKHSKPTNRLNQIELALQAPRRFKSIKENNLHIILKSQWALSQNERGTPSKPN